MPLPRENRQARRQSLYWSYVLNVTLGIFLFLGSAAPSPAQLPKLAAPPPAKVEPAAPLDPLGRETPRSAFLGFLKYAQRQDFATAAQYLQPTRGRDPKLVQRAEELQELLSKFQGTPALLSDDPDGTVEAGLPPGQVRAGELVEGGTTVDLMLVRVDDRDSGKIWLLSRETVAKIPGLYAQMKSVEPTAANRFAAFSLSGRQLLGMSVRQWLGWLVSIPISWLLAWLLAFLLSAPRRVWRKLRKVHFRTVWETPLGTPLRCIMAILLHGLLVYLLKPPLLYRVYYARFLATLLVASSAWLVSSISDQGFQHAVKHSQKQRAGGESILIVMQRLMHVLMIIIALVAALALFGLNVKTALAGLGIGGLAVALAAQKTLENLIGGVSLLMDKAVRVGDVCKIGDRVGTIEDIGLRSLKLRTVDQNLLVVPNGMLAQMQFENLKARPKLLIHQNFSLRIETQVEQLRFVLDATQKMLNEHSRIEPGTSRLRVIDFAGAAFELELFAYGKTGDWADFTAIRQDVILKIAEIVKAAGTRLAAPTQLNYLSRDENVDAEKANGTVRHVIELQASDSFGFPAESRTGTK